MTRSDWWITAATILAVIALAFAGCGIDHTPRAKTSPKREARTAPSAASRDLTRLPLSGVKAVSPFLSGQGVTPAASPSAARSARPARAAESSSAGNTHPSPTSITGPADDGPGVSSDAGKRAATPGPTNNVWNRLAFCESRNQWHINSGNGYYGGLQENVDFWRSYGDPRYARPDLAPKAAQIAAAVKARDGGRGYEPWPQCSVKVGLR